MQILVVGFVFSFQFTLFFYFFILKTRVLLSTKKKEKDFCSSFSLVFGLCCIWGFGGFWELFMFMEVSLRSKSCICLDF